MTETDRGEMLAAVLEHYDVQLQRQTGQFSISCPLHDDSHKSGSVDLNEGLWNCFVCGIGGDAYRLVEIKEEVRFSEAKRIAERIAGSSGVDVRGGAGEDTTGYLLPRRTRTRSGRKASVSTWVRSFPNGGS